MITAAENMLKDDISDKKKDLKNQQKVLPATIQK